MEIMARVAETTPEEYQQFAEGTTIFTAEEALAAFEDGDDTTSLPHTAGLINPFLVESGFTETEAPLEGLFDASFTADWVERQDGCDGDDRDRHRRPRTNSTPGPPRRRAAGTHDRHPGP